MHNARYKQLYLIPQVMLVSASVEDPDPPGSEPFYQSRSGPDLPDKSDPDPKCSVGDPNPNPNPKGSERFEGSESE